MAADQGDPEAQLNLGAMYSRGEGVIQDKPKAFELYKKAVEKNKAKAAFIRGAMLSKGDGVKKDQKEAEK